MPCSKFYPSSSVARLAAVLLMLGLHASPSFGQADAPASHRTSDHGCLDTKIPFSPGRWIHLRGDDLPAGAEDFRARHGVSWRVSLDEDLGTVRYLEPLEEFLVPGIEGVDLGDELDHAAVTAALRGFVDGSSELFGVTSSDLGGGEVRRVGTGHVVVFSQVVAGGSVEAGGQLGAMSEPIAIRGAVLRFLLSSSGTLRYAKGYLLRSAPDLASRLVESGAWETAWISSDEVEARVEEDGRGFVSAERQFAFLEADARSPSAVWAVEVTDEEELTWHELRDPRSGEVLTRCAQVEHLTARVISRVFSSDLDDPFAHREDILEEPQYVPTVLLFMNDRERDGLAFLPDGNVRWNHDLSLDPFLFAEPLALDTRQPVTCQEGGDIETCDWTFDESLFGCVTPEMFLSPRFTDRSLESDAFRVGLGQLEFGGRCETLWVGRVHDYFSDFADFTVFINLNHPRDVHIPRVRERVSGWIHHFYAAAGMLLEARRISDQDHLRDGAFERLRIEPEEVARGEIDRMLWTPRFARRGRETRIEYTWFLNAGDDDDPFVVRANAMMVAHEVGHYLMRQMTEEDGSGHPLEEAVADALAAVFMNDPRVGFVRDESDEIVAGPYGRDLSAPTRGLPRPTEEDDARTFAEKLRPFVSAGFFGVREELDSELDRTLLRRVIFSWIRTYVRSSSGDGRRFEDGRTVLYELLKTLRGLELEAERLERIVRVLEESFPGDLFRPDRPFVRGDASLDGVIDISDAVSTLGFLFLQQPATECRDAMDADDDGEVSISDAIRTLMYLFGGAAALPAPHGACGVDPTSDALDCRDISCLR